jgi:hypothetical protein
MKIILSAALLLVAGSAIFGADNSAPAEKTFDAPHGLKVSVKMIGPYSEPADLQIICLFKHKPIGDTYQGAAKDTDEHLHGILSALRNRDEFVGELGETILFTPPTGSIPAKRFMVIGLGFVARFTTAGWPDCRSRSGSTPGKACSLGTRYPRRR